MVHIYALFFFHSAGSGSGTAGLRKRARRKLISDVEEAAVEPVTHIQQPEEPQAETSRVTELEREVASLKTELRELRNGCAVAVAAKNGLFTEQQVGS